MGGEVTGLSREYEQTRYTDPHNILRSEAIYGNGFQSPGGIVGFQETLVDRMPIHDGMKLLDVGSGLGGAAFFLADRFEVEVIGIDTAPTMIDLARARQTTPCKRGRVTFLNGNVYLNALEVNHFDLIYSRDVLMYDSDKEATFKRCHDLLKEGGYLCVSDFGAGKRTPAFEEYEAVSNYHLLTISEYAARIERAGFEVLVTDDISAVARQHLVDDLQHYQKRVAIADHAIRTDDARHISERWARKINFLDEGNLTQGFFLAVKRRRSL